MHRRWIQRRVVGTAVAFALGGPVTAHSAPSPEPPAAEPAAEPEAVPKDEPKAEHTCKRPDGDTRFRVTLPKDAELDDLLHWMMSVSFQRFLWDPQLRGGKVNVLSPETVTLDEAHALFHSALHTMNLTVEPAGDALRIVEIADADSRNLPVYGPDNRAPDGDRWITQLVRITSGNAGEIAKALEGLKGKQGSIVLVGETLVLTDTGSNVRRLLGVLDQLDQADVAREKIYFYQLRHADPEETATTVRDVFGESSGAPTKSKTKTKEPSDDTAVSRVIVDGRTRTLVIVAPERDYPTVRKLIERLDVAVPGGTGRLRVIELKHADPEEIANVLMQIGSGAPAKGKDGKNTGAAPSPAALGQALAGEIRVTPDPASHSIVVLASQADFEAVREVVAVLDRERKQVYIEVYLLELDMKNNIDAGASGHFGKALGQDGEKGLGFVSSQTGSTSANSAVLDSTVLSGLAAGVLGPMIPGSNALFGRDIPAFGVLIQALQTREDVNIVSEPHIYTADNKEASLLVGKKVPTPTAVTASFGSAVQSIERVPVALSIKVKPHVNDDLTVTLDIELENGGTSGPPDPQFGITTTERKIVLDDVVARDGQPLVLGGLVQESDSEKVRQVPGLGSIPLLGWLFKSKRKEKSRSNLLMVLVPHILDSPEDARRIHQRRMAERLEFLERYSAFKRRDLESAVNYSKKSGLLSAVNVEAARMQDEADARGIAEAELERIDTSGELGDAPQRVEPSAPAEAPSPAPTQGPAPRPGPATMPRNGKP